MPDDAAAVALNVTVTNPTTDGYLSVYPCGQTPPLASNVNYRADETVPNFVVAALGDDGAVCMTSQATTDIVVDLAGYVPAGSNLVPLPSPVRFLDTRTGLGSASRVGVGSVTAVQIGGLHGVPADADLVIFNATAVNASGPGFLSVFPCGQQPPATSTLNVNGGDIVPNLVVTRMGSDGKVCFFTNAAMDLVGDVAAFAAAGTSGVTMLPSPLRVMDTRVGIGGPTAPITSAGRSMSFASLPAPVPGTPSLVPESATAVITNITAVDATAPGFASVFPCAGVAPIVSNVNFTVDAAVANLALVGLAGDRSVCFDTNQSTDLILDVSGYVTGPDDLVPIAPVRVYDSRVGVDPHCQRGARINAAGQVEIIDLTTGSVVASTQVLSGVNDGFHSVGLAKDCSSAYVFGLGSAPNVRLGLDGSVKESFTGHADEVVTNIGLLYVNLGTPSLVGSPSVALQPAGAALFPLPAASAAPFVPAPLWHLIGATSDATMIALERPSDPSNLSSAKTIVYFDALGDELGSWTEPIGALFPMLSPDGTYVSYFLAGAWNVVSIGGTAIATMPPFVSSDPATKHDSARVVGWITDGSLLVCASGGIGSPSRALRWDLFSPLRPLVPADATVPCLDTAS